MRLTTVCLLASVGLLRMGGSIAWAQSCPAYVASPAPDYSSEKAEMFATRHVPNDPNNTSNEVCQVPTNGWLRKNNHGDNPTVTDNDYYRIHLKALSSGGCMPQYWDFWSGCQQLPQVYQYRYIGGSTVEQVSPSYSYFGAVQPNNFVNIQMLDTRNQTGTASPGHNVAFLNEGSYLIESNTPVQATSCNFSPTALEASFTANVLECKPEWFTNVPGTLNFRAPATGPITIAVPSGFSDALGAAQAAAADWATALGRTITAVENTTCDAGDELCIELDDDHGTVQDDPAGCASLGTSSPDSNGVWTARMRVRFEPNWQGGHSDNLRWTIAHELGHYFGLWNREHSSCGYDTTVMKGGNCYSTTAPPAGTALGPTASDVSALLNSTYASQVRSICGW